VLLTSSFLAVGTSHGFLGGVSLLSSADETLARTCPGPDACYYLTAGKDLLETGSISQANTWILNVWPPGVAIISGFYILLSRLGLALPIVAGGIAIVSWTVLLSLWHRYLRPRVGGTVAVVAVLGVALGQPVRGWYLADGLFYVESPSIVLFLGAVLALLMTNSGSTRRRATLGVVAGLLFAGAAYLRNLFELAGLILSATVVAILVVSLVHAVGAGDFRQLARRALVVNVALLACVVAFHAVTMPWRVVASSTIRPDNLSWGGVGISRATQWMPSDYMAENGMGWLVDSTINTPCRVDAGRCAEIFAAESESALPYGGAITTNGEFASAAFEAWTEYPIQWTAIKTKAALEFWFANPRAIDVREYFENGILLILMFFTAVLGWRRLGRAPFLMVAAVFVGTLGATYFLHFELRFAFPLKSALPLVGALCLPRFLISPSTSPAEADTDAGDQPAHELPEELNSHPGGGPRESRAGLEAL
jgi:hypothetical protein